MNFRTLYFILMSTVRYYVCGEYNYFLVSKWLNRLRDKYEVIFPINGEWHTPVIDPTSNAHMIKKCGSFTNKKIAIFNAFERCTCTNMFFRVKQSIDKGLAIIILCKLKPERLKEIMLSFLKKNEFEILDLDERLKDSQSIGIDIENILNDMKYPDLSDMDIKKYLPCVKNDNFANITKCVY